VVDRYQNELVFAKQVVVDAYNFCKANNTLEISQKGSRDLVTNLDFEIENFIVQQIKANFPGDGVLAEEQYADTALSNHRFWCIDPIDGTVNFARGLPLYGVQIALIQDKKPVVAAMYLPEFNDLYYASIGNGSFVNDARLSTSKAGHIKEAIISMGDFTKRDGQEIENARRVKALGGLVNDVLKVKMFGAACLDLAYISRGFTDIHVMFSFGLWDVLPGLLIAAEAGARYKTVSGEEYTLESDDIIVASSDALLEFVVERFRELKISD
jgi:myo-inositol-1(or 4)-monophosphatase